jgi:hypothetical protein
MVESGDIKNTLYPDWVDKNFGSEQAVVDLYNHMVKAGWYSKDVKSFFAKFACDLYSNGQYCQGVSQTNSISSIMAANNDTTSTNTTDNSHINASFSCVFNSQILKGVTKSLNGSDNLTYKLSTGGELQFNTDKNFVYVSRNDPNRKIKGTWDCNGTNEFIVNTENNARLDSKIGYWQYDVVAKSTVNSSTTSTSNVSGNVKMGDKGENVTEIQNLLIKNGFKNISKDGKADGVFGSRTLGAVKDFQSANKDKDGNQLKVDGIVGPATLEALKRRNLQENIIKKVLERNLEMKNK